MSLHIQSRRLLQSAVSSPSRIPVCTASCAQKRTISFFGWGKNKSEGAFNAPKNPLTEEYLKRKPQNQPKLVRGDLAPSSILEDEEAAGAKPADKTIEAPERRNPANMRAVLDPDPASRRRWQRKMVIKDIVKRGRMSKAQIVKRTEREFHLKSHNFPTSVKKLGPLARQITGKSIDDAITQMRFSKKLAAVNVRNTLVQAKNEAIVSRGMGLGTEETATQVIMTNDKKRVKVKNPTNMYVAQAWVGKGPYGRSPDYRARGQMFMMKNPTTHIAVLLKEEKTRIREHNERLEKIAKQKVWTQLPNRPINGQRQFYSW